MQILKHIDYTEEHIFQINQAFISKSEEDEEKLRLLKLEQDAQAKLNNVLKRQGYKNVDHEGVIIQNESPVLLFQNQESQKNALLDLINPYHKNQEYTA